MRAVIAAFPLVAAQLVDMNRALFAPAVNAPADYYGAQGALAYAEPVVLPVDAQQFAQPVLALAEEEAPEPGFFGLPAVVAVLAVGALAGATVGRAVAGSDAAAEEEAEEEADLEAALDAAHVLTLAGPLLADERKVAMLFGGGKAATKKAAPKKAAPKKVAARKPAPKKPAPKKPAATSGGRARGAGPNLQPAPWSPFKDLFSLSAVGGGQGNTLSN